MNLYDEDGKRVRFVVLNGGQALCETLQKAFNLDEPEKPKPFGVNINANSGPAKLDLSDIMMKAFRMPTPQEDARIRPGRWAPVGGGAAVTVSEVRPSFVEPSDVSALVTHQGGFQERLRSGQLHKRFYRLQGQKITSGSWLKGVNEGTTFARIRPGRWVSKRHHSIITVTEYHQPTHMATVRHADGYTEQVAGETLNEHYERLDGQLDGDTIDKAKSAEVRKLKEEKETLKKNLTNRIAQLDRIKARSARSTDIARAETRTAAFRQTLIWLSRGGR